MATTTENLCTNGSGGTPCRGMSLGWLRTRIQIRIWVGLGSFGYCQRGASPPRGVVHSLSWRPFMFVREIRIAQKRSQKDIQAGGSGKCSSDVFIN